MKITVFFVVSVILWISCIAVAVFRKMIKSKRIKLLNTSKILTAGVALSSLILFIPVYMNSFEGASGGIIEAFLLSVYSMIKMFLADGDYSFVASNLGNAPIWVETGYSLMFSVMYLLAPIMTFGFVLSFFKNISAYKQYISRFTSDVYVFSELNKKSLTLAYSLIEKCNGVCVFTDVYDSDEEEMSELIEKAEDISAICFKKDITTVNFSVHSKKSKIAFFAFSDDYNDNTVHAIHLVNKYKYRNNTDLYLLSSKEEAELLLLKSITEESTDPKDEVKIKIRRINDVRSLIARTLYEDGYDMIFKSAREDENGLKNIHALVIGMGQYGTEMTKALSWFCQMDGYRAEIDAFDINEKADTIFSSICPELMDSEHNGVFDKIGEAQYRISIHSGVDIDTKEFDDIVSSLDGISYVFISLGCDQKNISAAIKLRSLAARLGFYPTIQAVVFDSDKKEALQDIVNYRHQKYDIDFVGDIRECYSEKVILGSDLEKEALKRHMKWGRESQFWKFDYNYKSSVASAIHRKMKVLCNIPGVEKEADKRSDDELLILRRLEHRRWNAYMRSEGYVFGPERNDLAKMHNCLIPYEDLPLNEQIKDDD